MTFTILVYLSWLAFGLKRLLTYLHALQQDDYNNSRFLNWMVKYRVFDKKLSISLIFIPIFSFFFPVMLTHILLMLAFLYVARFEKDTRFHAKKKFALTARAKRILGVAFFCLALLGTWWFIMPFPLFWVACIQLVPLVLALSNVILYPIENRIQRRYWNEAFNKLASYRPLVIGITGSFGKTSTKHILAHILKTQAPTLMTPGSINTAMGIARIIRSKLEPEHKYFLVEMGAYGPGSIKNLCRLTPPDMALITAIGAAHYERFQSLETVALAKFELAEAVEEKGGKIIIPAGLLGFAHPREMHEENKSNYIVVGEDAKAGGNFHIQNIEQTPQGLRVNIFHDGKIIELQTPLYGLQQANNIALAYATAVTLGISPEDVATILRSTPQIQHRLEVKPQGDGTILIDDAYNSNPEGFPAALDLMPILAGAHGRKILITPGMVELGNTHDEVHEKIGAHAGRICDIAIIVNSPRILSFIRGFRKTGPDKSVIEVRNFQDASRWLQRNTQGGDVILIENDLPDIYENLPKI